MNEDPNKQSSDQPPRVVYVSRPAQPSAPVITEAVRQRHVNAIKRYPGLNLSEAEYVIADVKRHPIGIAIPLGSAALGIILILAGIVAYGPILRSLGISTDQAPSFGIVSLVGLILCGLLALTAYVGVWVYQANRFYLTNESVIQEIQHSLFSKRIQTINLDNIEDASFEQSGIVQMMFNYGSLRLSTEGEETTYRFRYASRPKEVTAKLTNAVEAFKNGRPVDDQ